MKNVNTRAWLSLAVLALVMVALLFGAAGTVRYWEAWVYLSIFIGGSALMTFDLVINDPARWRNWSWLGSTSASDGPPCLSPQL